MAEGMVHRRALKVADVDVTVTRTYVALPDTQAEVQGAHVAKGGIENEHGAGVR
jgi:hypothetical protein